MISVKSDNPSELYVSLWQMLNDEGELVSPRGKSIKELRPVAVEFTDPLNRVTFLKDRKINPFFQLAESLWILTGGSDVAWLKLFNGNIVQFSDNGEYFNAPYGERLRQWNKNDAHDIIINPVDQLSDAFVKLINDKDTRQAVAILYNPMFDNAHYTLLEKGKDICCNIALTFKIRNNKLHMTVFNRSNDIHWGLFGANLCQFSTIHECLYAWLLDKYPKLKMGTYTHITDSLHMYLKDYGAKSIPKQPPTDYYNFGFINEPRMSMTVHQFMDFNEHFEAIKHFFVEALPQLLDLPSDLRPVVELRDTFEKVLAMCPSDDYWDFALHSLFAYFLIKRNELMEGMRILDELPSCGWKVSMLHFLKSRIKKTIDSNNSSIIPNLYEEQIRRLSNDLVTGTNQQLVDYLSLV